MADPVETTWAHVLANWNDDEAHKAFVGTCLSEDRLPEAGKRYRQIKEEGGERAARAEEQIAKLLTLGMTLMQQNRTLPPPKRNRALTFLVMLALALLGIAIAVGLMGS